MILDAEADIDVVGEAADGARAVDIARELRPEVVLMDIRMPEMDGIEAIRPVVCPGGPDTPRVLISRPSTSTSTCTARCAQGPAASCSRMSRGTNWRPVYA